MTFTRPPKVFPFSFGGMKLNAAPDKLPPAKFPYASNIRAYTQTEVQSRPGQSLRFSLGSNPVTDIGSYLATSASGIVETPRYLARDSSDGVYLDNGTLVGTMAGGGASLGASLISVRPGASVAPWIYAATSKDYQKFSAPSISNAVTKQKVGIAEPQSPPDAAPVLVQATARTGVAANYTNAGVAGVPGDSPGAIASETITAAKRDPTGANQWSLGLPGYNGLSTFSIGQIVQINSSPAFVQDWINPNLTTSVTIAAIAYYSGNSGRCVIVPSGLGNSPDAPTFSGDAPSQNSVFQQSNVPSIRRGALLQLVGEVVYVLAVVQGPNGQISIETSTVGSHSVGETLSVIPTLVVLNPGVTPPSGLVTCDSILSTMSGAGIGTLSRTINLFSGLLYGGAGPQDDDLVCLFLHSSVANGFTEIRILFDVGDGTFNNNYFLYSISPAAVTPALSGAATMLGDAQLADQQSNIQDTIPGAGSPLAPGGWNTPIIFSLGEMVRVGNNGNSLANTVAVQIWVNAASGMQLGFGSLVLFGGGQQDVGDAGSPYFYRVRPRSSLTGVVGNPSPSTRYGVSVRRAKTELFLPSAGYDSQIDTWDIFRYGGSVTSWRFIGSTPSTNSTFIDNYDDDAAGAGDVLDFDNFEPWPTIHEPITGTITFSGHIGVATVTDPEASGFLPGTLVLIGGQNAYTLWARPTLISGNNYLFQFVESAGLGNGMSYTIQEPILANQHLPYVFGPDATGTVFGVGDVHRPGNLNFSKNYAPDQVPDSYNIEITPPSKPLMGGEIVDGLAFVASPERWWALYPQPDNPAQRYNVVQLPILRGLAAPFAHCNDGQQFYFWAKDGIYSQNGGSLTDGDLYNLFPHEGVLGVAVTYDGNTVQPPDYSRAATFRLSYGNGYLYADYQDSTGTYRTLVLDTRTGAWSIDSYSPAVTVHYHPPQQAGTLQTSTARYDELLMGTVVRAGGKSAVAAASPNSNDLDGPISCALATFEFDGGDSRAPKQWGDIFTDTTPAASGKVSVTPMSLGAQVVSATQLPVSASRSRSPVGMGTSPVASDFMGLLFAWTDDFSQQSAPTVLFGWEPSFILQPAKTIQWTTLGTSFGVDGYAHIREVLLAWISTAQITLTITTQDGQSPSPVVLPSSAGAYQKQLFPVSPNKGLLFKFNAQSSAPFQIFLEDSELRVGAWSRSGSYAVIRDFGGVGPSGQL